jgi:N-methylhydantoinase A
MGLRIAADIGGTFTDVALLRPDGRLATRKLPSTPHDYAEAVVTGIRELLRELDVAVGDVTEVLHGTTVATNTILEGKGATTALLTTRGFRDVLELRRTRVPRLYDPLYVKPEPLAPRQLRFEVTERLGPRGEVLVPLNRSDVLEAIAVLRAENVEAVAVSFLHSYANPAHEIEAGQMLRAELPHAFVTLSAEVLPEIREYERTSTAVINAYVGPPVSRYLRSLMDRLRAIGIDGRLLIMQSSGGIIDADAVLDRPAQIVECGPAAGVIGSAYIGGTIGRSELITFDMGGTTAKASTIEHGRLVRTDESEVGGGISLSSRLVKGNGYALKLPVLDISEVGAGGGSIARVDKAGLLKVGPDSAGAVPGPACYDTGGNEATVTDANVVLGYINPRALACGTLPIRASRSKEVVESKIARPLGQSLLDAAYGVYLVATSTMMRAIKAVSTYRGRDPRDFTMVAFGGNGGIFAAELARSLHIGEIIVPPAAGVFSAIGLLASDFELIQSRAYLYAVDRVDPEHLENALRALEREVCARLGNGVQTLALRAEVAMRYVGQAFELMVPVPKTRLSRESVMAMADAFEQEHERTYGHRFSGDMPTEIVAVRMTGVRPPASRPTFAAPSQCGGARETTRQCYYGRDAGMLATPVLARADLCGVGRPGPLIVEEYEGTTVVPPGFRAHLDRWSNILVSMQTGGAAA